MSGAYFYHLTRQPLEVTLTMLLGKAQSAGWKTVVRGTDRARLSWLDEKLWLGPEEAFLPHGLEGGAHDGLQPILLSDQPVLKDGTRCLMAIDGAEVTVEEIKSLDRVCILFDGHDETALNAARGQWKSLTDAGAPATYWSEESGRWEMKAEKN